MMNMRYVGGWCVCLLSAWVTAENTQQIEDNIKQLEADIVYDMDVQNRVYRDLQQIELKIAKLDQLIRRLKKRIRQNAQRLKQVESKKQSLQRLVRNQQHNIGYALRDAWRIGREGKIKLLLNQQSIKSVGRLSVYYDYFSRASQENIDRYRKQIMVLRQLKIEAARTLRTQQERHRQVHDNYAAMEQSKRAQSELLRALRQETASKQNALSESRRRLREILRSSTPSVRIVNVPSFSTQKGKLNWPTLGHRTHHYNDNRLIRGVTIMADEGAVVRAVHSGTVILADWLKYYGLLLIIDHGDDYFSLYAHNQGLLFDEGAQVQEGEPIAIVGRTGGQNDPRLYLEIRHRHRILDSRTWFAQR